MIGLEHIWGAVGCAFGVCFATACLSLERLYEEWIHGKQQTKRQEN